MKRFDPNLFAHNIVGVQPMSAPVSLAYALRYTRFGEMKIYLSKLKVDAYNCNLKDYTEATKL